MKRLTFVALACLILLAAAFLRIADLHRFPPGLHYDEAADMLLSRDIAWFGYRPFPVVSAYSGREALFYYVAAPMLRIFGTNIMASRLTSAFLGVLAVAATIALGKALYRLRSIALLAGAWLAVSGPQVWLTRQGFRTSPQPLLEALGLWLLWVTLRRTRRWMWPAILGGVFCGLALYVYMAARIFPLWLALPLAILILIDGQQRWLRLRQAIVFCVALGLTAAPIVWYYGTHLDVFADRLSQLAPTDSTPTLLQSLRLHMEMFFLRGDPLLRYNLAVGRPYFDPLSGLLFVLGLILSAYLLLRGKTALERTGAAFVALCPLLIIPSVIAVQGLPPSHMRSVAMVPLVFFLPASAVVFLGRYLRRPGLHIALAILLFAALGAYMWHDYQAWGGRADLFYDSDGDLNLAASWLEKQAPPDATLYIASQYYEHPTVLAHNLDPQRIRWMMADHLLLPPPDRPATYIFPRSVHSTVWQAFLKAGAAQKIPSGPDGLPAFVAYQFAPNTLRLPQPSVPLSVNIGNLIRLRGADLGTAQAGQKAASTLYWDILNSPGRDDLAPVISLVDAWNNEISRVNPYFEHTAQWETGSSLIERVELPIPAGSPPGDYTIKVAWVGKSRANDYLPVLDAQGRFAGVWTEAKPLIVRAAMDANQTVPAQAVAITPELSALASSLPPTLVRQGEHVRFTVDWYARQAPGNLGQVLVTATRTVSDVDSNPGEIVLWSGNPVHDSYPFSAWQAGQHVKDRYEIPIPADFAAGNYRLTLRLAGSAQPVFTRDLAVVAVSRIFQVPPMAHAEKAAFGDAISLVGYDVQPASGAATQITVKLAWQARAVPDRDYTVFVHVARTDGTLFSQVDSPPTRPTSQWVNGEVVEGEYTLAVPAAPEQYTVTVGLYTQDNGLRLPVNGSSGEPLGDELHLSR